MADVIDPSTANLLQAGGVALFAGAVLLWLRDFKKDVTPLFTALSATLLDVKTTLAALLERERAKAERYAAIDAANGRSRRAAAAAAAAVPEEFDEDPPTQPLALASLRRTSPGGYSSQRPRSEDG